MFTLCHILLLGDKILKISIRVLTMDIPDVIFCGICIISYLLSLIIMLSSPFLLIHIWLQFSLWSLLRNNL